MARKFKAIMSKVLKAGVNKNESVNNLDQLTSTEQKIKAIMAKIFKLDVNQINEETSSDNVDQWTSLEHVDFVLNLQKKFDIEFTDSQIVEELLSYKTVVQTVDAALQEKNHR